MPNINKEVKCSKNKLKKYVNINKYIRKTQKVIKKHKFFIKNVKLNRERLQLIDRLDIYASKLKNNTLKYKNDIQNLQSEIDHLEAKLKSVTSKYDQSENQLREYILAMNKLMACSASEQTGDPDIINNSSLTNCSLPKCDSRVAESCVLPATDSSQLSNNSITPNCTATNANIVIFSDEMGKDMGQLLSKACKSHTVINYCMPGLSYQNIMHKILTYNFSAHTTLIILIGDKGNVNKHTLSNYYSALNSLKVDKIIMFTFPYCHNMSQNIQGMIGKDLEIELFLDNSNVDILCITEHWLKTEQI
ncbi:uncharacterized protein [Epargyreus clarus]|uniref:uncharacterized protein n=1 Tax=Epargyreus clarus TaxID=520877 RepID=UPI003C2AF7FD